MNGYLPLITPEGPLAHGTPEHATALTEGRHPGIRDGLQWLTYSHLPPKLQRFSAPFYDAAITLVQAITTDSPELTTALNGLVSAKDSAVRAGIRHDTGRAGSVPRPQTVVDPPKLETDRQTPGSVCSHGVRRDVSPQGWSAAHVSGYCGDPDPADNAVS